MEPIAAGTTMAALTSKRRRLPFFSWLAGLLLTGVVSADTFTVGPFAIEPVERKISAGGFPNTSANPFKRTPVTTFRVTYHGRPVMPQGLPPDRNAPWYDVRVLTGAAQPALLMMETGAVLLTEADGQVRQQELAPRLSPRTEWQWLDAQHGQPGVVNVVALAHRADQPRELTGGRWLSVFAQAVLDVKTLTVHRYTLNSTEVLDALQRYYAAEKPVLAFSPGGTQFVVLGERDRPGEPDPAKRFEYALIAFDFARQRGTVLPIVPAEWQLQGPQEIDAAFAQRVVAWRRGPDGHEQAYLRPSPAAAP